MSSKRSYLDTLNAGRQRKPGTTLEQITQSLQKLESRLDRSREALDDYGREARRPAWDEPASVGAPVHREPELPHFASQAAPRSEPEPSYHSLARDFDRVRGQEEGLASANRIASELKGLREELRQQVAANMNEEFEALRGELGRMLASSSHSSEVATGIATEVDRISQAVQELSERADDSAMNGLRHEIEQIKGALESLASEDAARASNSRWEEYDQRWQALEERIDQRQRARDPEISALSERVQSISEAVNNLPESLSLRSIDEKVRALGDAIDQFIQQQEYQAPETFRLIEERLDEISRAIVASTAANVPVLDPEPFERIEARISSLAKQIDEIIEDRPSAEVIENINALTRRVDEIAAKGHLPEQALERLSRQVAAVAEKIDRTPLAVEREAILRDMHERFDVLSTMFERRQHDAIEQGSMMFRDLERRLEDVAQRIDRNAADSLDKHRFMDAIDARFADLADQIASPGNANNLAIRNLEDRLESISARIDASAAKFAGIDSGLISSLEDQVAALSAHLSRPRTPLPELEDVGPRLDELERSVSSSRDAIVEAARQAAEAAVRSFENMPSGAAAASGLNEDLKALEDLTRRSDERNAKTFEAIHDTLIKIVDRLASVDSAEATPEPEAESVSEKTTVGPSRVIEIDTPPLHGDADEALDLPPLPTGSTEPAPVLEPADRMPAEAAAEAAAAAIATDAPEKNALQPRKSLFGGLSRALGRKEPKETAAAEPVEPVLAGDPAPEPTVTQPLDPKVANRPLEPGSGAPDLNAIMRRVREERNQSSKPGHSDAARQDFLAAARRHAQAAAAEAAIGGKSADDAAGTRRSGFGSFLKRYRKPALMAATGLLVVLAGAKLGQDYLDGEDEVAATPLAAGPQGHDAGPGSDPAVASGTTRGLDAAPVTGAKADDEPSTTGSITDMDGASAASDKPAAELDDSLAARMAGQPAVQTASFNAASPSAPDTVANTNGLQQIGPAALRDAAAAGDAKAMFEVGARYAEGRGVRVDMEQAAAWYEKSAELGFAPAQYRAGNLYEKATGVERDIAKAKMWYQESAEQGNASAMHNLAVLYAMGADGITDNAMALRWFGQAAEFGVKDSQFNLGILAAKGVGMPRDLRQSYKWFAIAAKTGDADAARKRDELAKSLQPDQLQAARTEVDAWKAKPLDPETNSVEIPESWHDAPTTTAAIDMTKAVRNIQAILIKNGYDAGNADGVMGQQTKDAIKAFQTDNKMEPTGEVDEKLVRALLDRK